MRIHVATPSAPDTLLGNSVTAARWAGLLEELGHEVCVARGWPGDARTVGDDARGETSRGALWADLLIALHARRSAEDVARWCAERGAAPRVVALTGTDLYEDLPRELAVVRGDTPPPPGSAHASLEAADLIVALHPGAEALVPSSVAKRVRPIVQSVSLPAELGPSAGPGNDEVLVPAHLRPVKDPLLAARAARRLAPGSRLRVVGLGESLDSATADEALREARENPRYRFEGPLPHADTLRRMAAARAVVLSSISEGGANVVGEACALGVPLLTTRIPSTVGLLGEDWPGWFEVGDEGHLAELLTRLEEDPGFDAILRERARRLAPRFAPAAEREAWRQLLGELA